MVWRRSQEDGFFLWSLIVGSFCQVWVIGGTGTIVIFDSPAELPLDAPHELAGAVRKKAARHVNARRGMVVLDDRAEVAD